MHEKCTELPFCKSCREILYMKADPDILDRLENMKFSNLIKNKGFLREKPTPHYMCKEILIKKIYIGNKKLQPLYLSPFTNISENIHICVFCFSYFNESISLNRHKMKCGQKYRGNLVYSKEKFKIFEVDGEFDTISCRNLCLLAKCFLDHKTLYYDVEPFLFYLLYENDNIIGYFSREKYSIKFNLSCIVVLPCYQGKGFGYFLIDFSYRLFQLFNRKGTPEKPLSDQGLAVYKKYWKYKVYKYLITQKKPISIKKIANKLAMTNSDVVYALELLEFLKKEKENYTIQIISKLFVELLTCDNNAIKIENVRLFKE